MVESIAARKSSHYDIRLRIQQCFRYFHSHRIAPDSLYHRQVAGSWVSLLDGYYVPGSQASGTHVAAILYGLASRRVDEANDV
jgi:hypothetical protein